MIKKSLIKLALVLVVLAASWALFHPEFFRAHDYIHAARIVEMSQALRDGHFPVRWSQNFGYGYGMPLFEFYAPLPYYVGSLFNLLGLSVLNSVRVIFLTSTIITAWGSYLLGRELFGKSGGLLMSAAISLAPYRAVNLFIRGAVSEAWGIMAMPWILWAICRLIKGQRQAWWQLTLGITVLMLSHNIMTLLFAPLATIFAVLFLGYQKWIGQKSSASQLNTILIITGASLLAAGMSAFYMLPALMENHLTKIESIFGGYFDYSHHFLYLRQFVIQNWGYTGSNWGPNDGFSFSLGYGQLIGLAFVALIMLIRLIKLKWKIYQERSFWLMGLFGLMLAISLFLTTTHAKPIWDTLPGLAYAQFPWRFLGVAIIFVGLLIGLLPSLIKHKLWRKIIVVSIFISLLFNAFLFKPEQFLDDHLQFYYTDPDLIRREMSGILPDYIPAQMSANLTPPSELVWAENPLDYQILVNKTHQKLVKVNVAEEMMINWAVADFPGWQLEVDGEKVVKNVTEMGNLAVLVPVGEHRLGIYFGHSNWRLLSDMISLVSWLVFFYLVIDFKDD